MVPIQRHSRNCYCRKSNPNTNKADRRQHDIYMSYEKLSYINKYLGNYWKGDKVKYSIIRAKPSKFLGLCCISTVMLKKLDTTAIEYRTYLLNLSTNQLVIPNIWKSLA